MKPIGQEYKTAKIESIGFSPKIDQIQSANTLITAMGCFSDLFQNDIGTYKIDKLFGLQIHADNITWE